MDRGILPGMDRDLLDRWRRDGDEAALAELIGRLAPLLRAAARSAGSPDADEAAQAACVLLARRPGSVPPDAIAGWAVLTARRIAANQRRAAARRHRHEQEAARMPRPAGAEADGDLRAALDDALARLSPARREAIVRFHLLGHSQAAIAAELGCSVDAVKTRIHEGIVRLRDHLVRRGHPVGLPAVAALLATVPPDPGLAVACRAAVREPSPALTALLPAGAFPVGLAAAMAALAGGALAVVLAGVDPPVPASSPAPIVAPAPVAFDPGDNGALDWCRAIAVERERDGGPVPQAGIDLLLRGGRSPVIVWGADTQAMPSDPMVASMTTLHAALLARARDHAVSNRGSLAIADALGAAQIARRWTVDAGAGPALRRAGPDRQRASLALLSDLLTSVPSATRAQIAVEARGLPAGRRVVADSDPALRATVADLDALWSQTTGAPFASDAWAHLDDAPTNAALDWWRAILLDREAAPRPALAKETPLPWRADPAAEIAFAQPDAALAAFVAGAAATTMHWGVDPDEGVSVRLPMIDPWRRLHARLLARVRWHAFHGRSASAATDAVAGVRTARRFAGPGDGFVMVMTGIGREADAIATAAAVLPWLDRADLDRLAQELDRLPAPPAPAAILAADGAVILSTFDRMLAVPELTRMSDGAAWAVDLGNGAGARHAWPGWMTDRGVTDGRAAYRAWLAAATAALAAHRTAPAPDQRQPWLDLFAVDPAPLVAAARRRDAQLMLLRAGIALAAGRPSPESGPGPAPRITVADAGEWLRRDIPAGVQHHIDRHPDGTATAFVRDDEGTLMIRSDRGWILGLGDGPDAVELTIGLPPRPRPAASAPGPAPGPAPGSAPGF